MKYRLYDTENAKNTHDTGVMRVQKTDIFDFCLKSPFFVLRSAFKMRKTDSKNTWDANVIL